MKDLQKTKKDRFTEKKRFYEGILDPEAFSRNYILRCYEPSEAMAPFVEHYFISRRRPQFEAAYVGYDVLSQPAVSFFIQPGGAFFQGPTVRKRILRAKDSPIYVGAQFKPAGFYPFWQQRVSNLTEKTVPALAILPDIQGLLDATFFDQADSAIVAAIDKLLCAKHPHHQANIALANEIVAYIEDGHAASVTAIAGDFALSERSLQQLFQTYVGVGIKWAVMRARFIEVTKYARNQKKPNWTTIATDFGYSDQPHFINDFKKIVGLSPQQYITLLRSHT